ncbi:MAG: aminotransferase class III-fold pyridoxal phosphate-dependent enzyme [Chloroflexi bacterium]|nr:aminotransferase class III-fold pyridoxal phosphate-dependent enzyme [Chloroflexota bacterium]MCY4247743.1 aminotransferase class III-fold pyridoxal phosphate-dependent enzyme [Chloroflexota bacterium]
MMDAATIVRLENRHGSGAYGKRPTALVKGQGLYVWDANGNRYLDATSGQGVAALGHCHPAVVAAIQAQASQLITAQESFYNDRRAELYPLLASLTPGDLDQFFLCNSGAEAIEGALKVAMLLTGRAGVVAAKRSFHGRTTGALSMTWTQKYRKPFMGWLPAATHVAYNDIAAAHAAITDATAAVVVEPVQGEGGVHPASPAYLQALRQRCDETGAMLVVDEIQTGFGRTGSMFGFEKARILPDIIALGKALAGGLPMGAVGWRSAHGQIPRASHGSTFGGNPLACAAAIAALRAIHELRLPDHASQTGAWMMDELRAANLRGAREVRGRGLMIGIELRGRVTPTLKALQERGILALPAGATTLRLLPPLIITRDELAIVRDAITEALGQAG